VLRQVQRKPRHDQDQPPRVYPVDALLNCGYTPVLGEV
jgi:hypothetical protein